KIWADGTRYITAIDSYYHSEKNAYMPNADGDKYRTCTLNDKNKNGHATYTWDAEEVIDKVPDKVTEDNGVEWKPAN
ncbi:MAG TPA: hypothetical protein PK986_08240, partial [Spirochaetota bacterium]|nr:hypothetical protein [Spirochaetota bacterium]